MKETDTLLVRQIREGDEEAFMQFYDDSHVDLYRYIYRLVPDRQTAEDILSETYTETWRGIKFFRGESSLKSWMFGIARNLVMSSFRKTRNHEDIEDHAEVMACTNHDPESADRREQVSRAMALLPPKHREVLDLVFFHEMDYGEVADILKIPLGTVKTRVFHAKDSFREALENIGIKRYDI